jgi:hypothetical protein
MLDIKTINTDIAIIGGGILGLWLTNLLKANGLNCLLLEQNAIGSNQTINSQGMLHSGVKYALQGTITSDMKAISDSEALLLWQQAFQGLSDITLTNNCALINEQYLWSNSKLSSKFANFFVSKLLKSKVQKLNNYPEPFLPQYFTGSLYKLHETVLNLPIVLQELFEKIADNSIKIDNINLELTNNNISKFFVNISGEQFLVKARQYIFTAGEGIKNFSKIFNNGPLMQVRPLHMVAVKAKNLPMLYGHNIGLNSLPIISITSHKTIDNQIVWYAGGQIAEDGVNKTSAQQLIDFKKLLNFIFPWLDFNSKEYSWGSFYINRAEHLQPNGKKPNSATWFKLNNAIFAWPTKLVLAPMLASEIFKALNIKAESSNNNIEFLAKLPKPELATPWWGNI